MMLELEGFKPFFDALNSQTKIVVDLSAAGIVVIIVTWLRSVGVFNDHPAMTKFKMPWFLVVPLAGFGFSVVYGYVVGQISIGFYFEAILKEDLSSGDSISDIEALVDHFKIQYQGPLTIQSYVQLTGLTIGVATLVPWYAGNVISYALAKRRKRCGQNK